MSLRILFADDSVTAQNMGKKILTDAGYDVVAVSNGAAAVKKIAEQRPDIIILDVYMPGYSGLEVCEKVRASVATVNIPVLLTVGKMEPYQPEEANRVKADGVIVKPFEASDLLAIIKKFEERLVLAAVPQPTEQLDLERFGESAAALAVRTEHPEPVILSTTQPTVEVPDHMATTSAFSDLLGTDPSSSIDAFKASAPSPAHVAAPRATVPDAAPAAAVPDYDLPFSWRDAADAEEYASTAATPPAPRPAVESAIAKPSLVPPPAAAAPIVAAPLVESAIARPSLVPPPARFVQIPVYREPEPETEELATPPEVVPTAAPPTDEFEIPREPALLETAAETTRNTIADSTEPGLMPTMQHEEEPAPVEDTDVVEAASAESPYASVYTPEVPAIAAETPVETAAPASPDPASPDENESTGEQGTGPATISDSDFEARVAAAIAAYSHAANSQPGEESAAETPADAVEQAPDLISSDVNHQPAASEIPPPESFHTGASQFTQEPELEPEPETPSFEYYPPVGAPHTAQATEAVSAVPEPAASYSAPVAYVPATYVPAATEPAPLEPVVAHPAAAGIHQDAVKASLEAALPTADEIAAAAAAQTEADHHTITQTVHRVMERLKSELVEEIMRELKSKK